MASNDLQSAGFICIIHKFCLLINVILNFINLGLAKLVWPQDAVRASSHFIPACIKVTVYKMFHTQQGTMLLCGMI